MAVNNERNCGNLPPTFNTSWVIATSLCVWFLFIHAPITISSAEYFKPRLLWVHLFGVYSIYLICAHNTLFTPSTLGGAARPFHIWAGRIGLILGVVGFVSGFVLTWYILDPNADIGFSIGITFGGICQLQAQFFGYRAIKRFQRVRAKIEAEEYQNQQELFALEDEQDEHLSIHIINMINLFVLACGIPGLIRLIGTIGGIFLLPSIIGIYYLSFFMTQPIMEKMKAKRASERGLFDEGEDAELTRYTIASHYQTVTKLS